MTLVAEQASADGEKAIIAMGQLIKLHGNNDAEFAILVSDQYQRTGLGTEILTRLIDIGRDEQLDRVVAEILPQNEGMKRVCRKLGFELEHNRAHGVVAAAIEL